MYLNATNKFHFSDATTVKVEHARPRDSDRGRTRGRGRGKTDRGNIIQVKFYTKYSSAFCSINHKSILFLVYRYMVRRNVHGTYH